MAATTASKGAAELLRNAVVVNAAGGKHTATLLFLHGLGDTGSAGEREGASCSCRSRLCGGLCCCMYCMLAGLRGSCEVYSYEL